MSTCFLAFASLCFVCELVSRSSLSIFPFDFGNCSFLCAASFPVPNCSKIVQNMTSYLLDRKHNGVKEKCGFKRKRGPQYPGYRIALIQYLHKAPDNVADVALLC